MSLRGLSPASFHHCGQEGGDAEYKVEDRMAWMRDDRRGSHSGLQRIALSIPPRNPDSHHKDHFLAKNPSFIYIRDSHSLG